MSPFAKDAFDTLFLSLCLEHASGSWCLSRLKSFMKMSSSPLYQGHEIAVKDHIALGSLHARPAPFADNSSNQPCAHVPARWRQSFLVPPHVRKVVFPPRNAYDGTTPCDLISATPRQLRR